MANGVTDAHHESDGHDLGARLKFFREQNGLSQRELAKRAGVPHSSISMIEQGLSSPSVNSLIKILSGIPLDISHFFACDLASYSESTFTAAALAKSQRLLFADAFVQAIPLLLPKYKAAEFQRLEMMPNSDTGLTPQVSTESFSGYLAQGQLEVTIGAQVSELGAGDAFAIQAHQPYRMKNNSSDYSCIILICRA